MPYHVAALSLTPAARPLATEPPRPPAGAAEQPALLPTLVDWALQRLGPTQLLSDPSEPDRSVRIAMVAGHFDALAQLARQPAMDGVRINAGTLVVDAGHLTPGKPQDAADAGLLVGAAHGSLRGPGKDEPVRASVRAFLDRMAVTPDTQVVVLASYGRQPVQHRAATIDATDQSMGRGRRASAAEARSEAALWARLEGHVAEMGGAHPRVVSDGVASFWYDVKPGLNSLSGQLAGTRGFIGTLVFERFRPLIDGLRHALADGSIDPERAHALVAAALDDTREAVRAHDDPLPPAPPEDVAPAPVLSEAERRAQEPLFLPAHSPTAEETAAESLVWRSLDRVITDLQQAEGSQSRLTSLLWELRGQFAPTGRYDQHAMEGRSYLRNVVLQSCRPALEQAAERLQAGDWDPATASGHVRAVIAAHRDAVRAHDARWVTRS